MRNEGIVEGDDGNVLRDPQPKRRAGTLKAYSQHIIADHQGSGTVRAAEQFPECVCLVEIRTFRLEVVIRTQRQVVLKQRQLIAGEALSRENKGAFAA